MHRFDDLISRSTSFTLSALNDANKRINKKIGKTGSTILVKNLQMIQLQKVISAVGMFSIFDAELQGELRCENGFHGAKEILRQKGNLELLELFDNFICAINVLKHGEGRSYETLVSKVDILPFRIKMPGEYFFAEGDVSEVDTLIQVDDQFVLQCADLIERVSKEIA
jgi:hypothetical protein